MVEEKIPDMTILDHNSVDHKITDLYFSLNFDLIKVSDSKASTLIVISGQSILITAFLLANILGFPNVSSIAIGFAISVVFNTTAVYFALSALQPRTFQEPSTSLQPLYTHIVKRTRDQFIKEFIILHHLSKEKNDRHYAELIYHISSILHKKMRYVHIGTRLFVVGIFALVISIFTLVVQVFLI
ncbi:MAG: Pycsar system effector family protein [Candidatus Helarchaeota archaeon]